MNSAAETDRPFSLLQRLPLARDRRWAAYGFAIVASLAGLVLRQEIDSLIPAGFQYLTFFPVVIVTAFFFGVGPGIAAAVLSGLAAWYYFIPPFDSFDLSYAAALALGFYLVIVTVDIALVHWMQRANAHLAQERARSDKLADTREMLFNELQHRVGNNLQMVASLLAMQGHGLKGPIARDALADAARRVALIGRIQRTLYSHDGEQLALGSFIDTIVRETIEASGRKDIGYSFQGDIGQAKLDPSDAIPAALVVTEAVSNSIEHGLSAGAGTISVVVQEQDGGCRIEVTDDGAGLPEGFDLAAADSLGLKIASNLARSLGGQFTLAPRNRGHGTLAALDISARRVQG
ncbi:sensor histidine kinase [Qipengyuania marisflavi]|uniref:DUF4118 domain-containing protein n=1 Tax=Qipengyuania marisflavi TaxID=2486356 RepID=A0A5S3P0C8_9SPHN|nr:histidine kinase dimerization/phosphoacceptor domain -containing protein [Qipengyuania marisflavi]TMM46204.1 DUF4118 domain-containing protein [Qipengyuania marisflavi]